MVHLLEQSIASVELNVSADYSLTARQSGLLSTSFRIPYGFGAILAGIVADRLGARRVLVAYLAGAAVTCIGITFCPSSTVVYGLLFVLGCFASIYHPAGLALLANSTTISERSRALGIHGVFGSTGIAAAPFFAGLTLSLPSITWKGYYLLLSVFCGLLAVMLGKFLKAMPDESIAGSHTLTQGSANQAAATVRIPKISVVKKLHRFPFFALVLSAGTSGIVYGGFLHFLTRYLSEAPELSNLISPSYYTALALICGAAGQFLAGRIAHPKYLPQLLAAVYAANAPLLWWMSFASGVDRLLVVCVLAFVHFMNQPLYNSLLPEYIPPAQRSTWFGFSNMLGFGLGAVGPYFVGSFAEYQIAYRWLALVALVAAVFPLLLCIRRFQRVPVDA